MENILRPSADDTTSISYVPLIDDAGINACGDAEEALHDAGNDQTILGPALTNGAATVVDSNRQVEQQGRQGAAAARSTQRNRLRPMSAGAAITLSCGGVAPQWAAACRASPSAVIDPPLTG